MKLVTYGLVAVLAMAARGSKDELSGKQTSTDRYRETTSRGDTFGDLQVSTEVTGDAATVRFAPAPRTWKDPRPKRIELPIVA